MNSFDNLYKIPNRINSSSTNHDIDISANKLNFSNSNNNIDINMSIYERL